MIPTKDEVIKLLKTSKRATENPGWLAHSLGVGDAAGRIAAAVNKTTGKTTSKPESIEPIDVEGIIKKGYLHDIGKTVGAAHLHPINGYYYMQKLGYDEDYCAISLTHSFVNNDPFCMFSDFMQPDRDHEVIEYIKNHDFTIEEKIIALSDMIVYIAPTTLDKRIVDVISRHGAGHKLQERIAASFALKAYFDDLLQFNLYDLFPEIKENL